MQLSVFAGRAQEVFNERLFDIGGTPITLATIATFVVIIAIFWIASRVLRGLIARAAAARGMADAGGVQITLRVLHSVVVLLGVLTALSTVGIKLTAVFAAGAVFAVGLGIGMQNAVQNLIAGFILMMERSTRKGHVLEVEGNLVKVQEIRMRSTTAVTLNGEHVIMPNAMLVQSKITNLSYKNSLYRLRIIVGVTYSSDLNLVRRTLETVVKDLSWRSDKRNSVVLLKDFGSSSVDYEVCVWTERPWDTPVLQSELREAIWFAFKQHDIVIAFPQLDVHFDPSVTHSFSRLAA